MILGLFYIVNYHIIRLIKKVLYRYIRLYLVIGLSIFFLFSTFRLFYRYIFLSIIISNFNLISLSLSLSFWLSLTLAISIYLFLSNYLMKYLKTYITSFPSHRNYICIYRSKYLYAIKPSTQRKWNSFTRYIKLNAFFSNRYNVINYRVM